MRGRAPPGRVASAPMIALSATQATLGLVVVFFVVFPLLLHGLIGFAVAQVLGERAEEPGVHGRHQAALVARLGTP